MHVQHKFVIAFEVAEGDGVDRGEGYFPPDGEFVLEGNQLGENGFYKILTFNEVVNGAVSE